MIHTEIEGDPDEIEAAATFLRAIVGCGSEAVANTSAQERLRLAAAWEGDAGSAFVGCARTLSTAADDLAVAANRSALSLDALATQLRTAQTALLTIRQEAIAAGLPVHGTVVERPYDESLVDMSFGPPSPYWALVRRYDSAMSAWQGALDLAAVETRSTANSLQLATANLLSVAFTTYLVALNSDVLRRQAQHFEAEALRRRADALSYLSRYQEGRVRMHLGEYDDLMDRMRTAQKNALESLDAAREIPPAAGRIGGALNLLTGVYGVAVDIKEGESTTQAVASQGLGLAAAVGTGAGMGTLIPIPVLGTLVGGVLGMGAGLLGDKAVDRVLEGPPAKYPPRPSTMGYRVLGDEEARVSQLLGGNPEVEPPGFYPKPS